MVNFRRFQTEASDSGTQKVPLLRLFICSLKTNLDPVKAFENKPQNSQIKQEREDKRFQGGKHKSCTCMLFWCERGSRDYPGWSRNCVTD